VARGVMLNAEQGGGPQFDYTRLNDIKPALIAEATAAARKSAEQFAKDSGARLGGIRTANQGVVSIENRDAGSPQIKKIRVVSTVEYFLTD
ncbi:MAG: SIMPL domain-containing protein, partial [Thermomonas sp.]